MEQFYNFSINKVQVVLISKLGLEKIIAVINMDCLECYWIIKLKKWMQGYCLFKSKCCKFERALTKTVIWKFAV